MWPVYPDHLPDELLHPGPCFSRHSRPARGQFWEGCFSLPLFVLLIPVFFDLLVMVIVVVVVVMVTGQGGTAIECLGLQIRQLSEPACLFLFFVLFLFVCLFFFVFFFGVSTSHRRM